MSIKKHQVKSKLAVAYVLENTPQLRCFIPETELLNKISFTRMIDEYDILYLKPDRGRKSRDIIWIKRLFDPQQYILCRSYSEEQKEFKSKSSLWLAVKEIISGTKYIIQQGIDSKTAAQRHFDLRCHVLRVNGKWVVGGICARLGAPEKFVTTSHHGGTPTLIEILLNQHLNYSREEENEIMQRLHKCILAAANAISPMYPNLKEFAVDIGIDPEKRIWIFEVNIEPLIRGNFKLLPDKTMYRLICSLRKIAK